MINLRNIFNPNYNIILILSTIILFFILIYKNNNLKHIAKILIYTAISMISINLICQLIIKIIPNNIIKTFLLPIINNISKNILMNSLIVISIGFVLLLISKKNKTSN